MFRNSCFFISVKMFMLYIRRRIRYGREYEKRIIRFYIKPSFNLLAMAKLKG